MSWFPPLPGDQPNEPIIPIGQTEEETPEPETGVTHSYDECEYRREDEEVVDGDVTCWWCSIFTVCDRAGLGVMVQVYEIIHDREVVTEEALLAIDDNEVTNHYYSWMGPAIDKIERWFTEE